MKIVSFLLAFIIIAQLTAGEITYKEVTVGPYDVSFDLGRPDTEIQTEGPTPGTSYDGTHYNDYVIKVKGNGFNDYMVIDIRGFRISLH